MVYGNDSYGSACLSFIFSCTSVKLYFSAWLEIKTCFDRFVFLTVIS